MCSRPNPKDSSILQQVEAYCLRTLQLIIICAAVLAGAVDTADYPDRVFPCDFSAVLRWLFELSPPGGGGVQIKVRGCGWVGDF